MEYADLLVPIFSFTYCGIGLLLIIMSMWQSKVWSNAHNLHVLEILDNYYGSRSPTLWGKLYNHFHGRSEIEFRILRNIFTTEFRIQYKALPFDSYAENVFDRFVLRIIRIRHWDRLLFCVVLVLNLARIKLNLDYSNCGGVDSSADKEEYIRCKEYSSMMLFTIVGVIIFFITALQAVLARRIEVSILRRNGILSTKQYALFLERMEINSAEEKQDDYSEAGKLDKSALKLAAIDVVHSEKKKRLSDPFSRLRFLFVAPQNMNAEVLYQRINSHVNATMEVKKLQREGSCSAAVDGRKLSLAQQKYAVVDMSEAVTARSPVVEWSAVGQRTPPPEVPQRSDHVLPFDEIEQEDVEDPAESAERNVKGVNVFRHEDSGNRLSSHRERVLHFGSGVSMKIIPLETESAATVSALSPGKRIFPQQVDGTPAMGNSGEEEKPCTQDEDLALPRKDYSLRNTWCGLPIHPLVADCEDSVHVPRRGLSTADMTLSPQRKPLPVRSTATMEMEMEMEEGIARARRPTRLNRENTLKAFLRFPSTVFLSGPSMKKESPFAHSLDELFFLSSPALFFESIHALMMFISLYLALFLTNFLSTAPDAGWVIICLVPGLCSATIFIWLVRKAALIKAVYKVDCKAVLAVLEQVESAETLSELVRRTLLTKLASLAGIEVDMDQFCSGAMDPFEKNLLEGNMQAELYGLFDEIDTSKDGLLSRSEFVCFMNAMGINMKYRKWIKVSPPPPPPPLLIGPLTSLLFLDR